MEGGPRSARAENNKVCATFSRRRPRDHSSRELALRPSLCQMLVLRFVVEVRSGRGRPRWGRRFGRRPRLHQHTHTHTNKRNTLPDAPCAFATGTLQCSHINMARARTRDAAGSASHPCLADGELRRQHACAPCEHAGPASGGQVASAQGRPLLRIRACMVFNGSSAAIGGHRPLPMTGTLSGAHLLFFVPAPGMFSGERPCSGPAQVASGGTGCRRHLSSGRPLRLSFSAGRAS